MGRAPPWDIRDRGKPRKTAVLAGFAVLLGIKRVFSRNVVACDTLSEDQWGDRQWWTGGVREGSGKKTSVGRRRPFPLTCRKLAHKPKIRSSLGSVSCESKKNLIRSVCVRRSPVVRGNNV